MVGQLRNALARVSGVEDAYLYGSFARDQSDALSDIDILIVGRPDPAQLEKMIGKIDRQLRREVNYTALSPEEFKIRRAKRDAFLEDFWRHKRIRLAS